MVSSMLGFHPLDASSTSPVVIIENVCRHCQMLPGGQICPHLIAMDVVQGDNLQPTSHILPFTCFGVGQQAKNGFHIFKWLKEIKKTLFCDT